MQWNNVNTAKLTVTKAGSDETLNFAGVNSNNNAGTPEDFLNAVNHILDIGGLSATANGMTRTIQQEATENG